MESTLIFSLALSILLIIPLIKTVSYLGVHNLREDLPRIVLFLMVSGSAFLGYYALKISLVYGIFQFTFPFLFLISIMIFYYSGRDSRLENISRIASALTLILSTVMFIVTIPIALVPFYSEPIPHEAPAFPEQISAEPIVHNLNQIKQSLSSAEDQLVAQYADINELATNLIEYIDQKNNELLSIYEERERVENELEYYKSLASLTEEQALAVINSLNRNRIVDYAVGAFITIVICVILYFLQRFYPLKSGKQLVKPLKQSASTQRVAQRKRAKPRKRNSAE